MRMDKTLIAALIAFALLGGALAAGPAAIADSVVIGIAPGSIAFGYNDGYWDRDHHWHAWARREDAERFRAEDREHYFDRKHDEDHDGGWRESDRYWDRH